MSKNQFIFFSLLISEFELLIEEVFEKKNQ